MTLLGGATKYYFDFNFPLKVVQFILNLIFGKKGQAAIDTGVREWFSQPRPGNDTGIEVISTIFKLPLSISEVTTDILRVPCTLEVWYQDRSNNWRQVMDMQRIPLHVTVSGSDAKSWYKYHVKCYPIVAKQLQLRITRTNDITLENIPYVCGLRNTLIRRNVYDRAQGSQYFEEEQDILGNVITKYIKDWDAGRAFDDNPTTFWKSEAMPDPLAVVSLYLDVRGDDGTPKLVDKVYLDPVYTGQMLNLYYSSDSTVGTRKLSPITIYPDEDVNTAWRIQRGRTDTAGAPTDDAYYRFPFNVGPLIREDAWMGVEWAPAFDPTAGPPRNPVLIRAISTGPTTAFKPSVYYDVGAAEFILEFTDGTDTRTYTAPVTQLFTSGEPLRIVAGWSYDPDTVYISVVNRTGQEIAHLEDEPTTLPELVSFDGQIEHWNFRGILTATIIKLDHWSHSANFQASPVYYTMPDPVIPDAQGRIPATSLDNAIYVRSSTAQEHGTGGASETHYEDKEWTPVWRDYLTVKGMMYLPQAISMKFLKLEFTNLTCEPYPVYESGIEVRYKVFPTSVTQQSSLGPRIYTGEGGPLGLGTFISVNGVRSVNWLSPQSVINAIGTVFSPQIPPVVINQGNPYITEAIPQAQDANASENYRVEMSSSYVYRRDTLDPYILATDQYNTIIKAEGLQALQDFTDVPWDEIAAANPGAITRVRGSIGAVPVRGTDWWIFPGQQLKIPAAVMTKLTDTSTVTESKLTLEHRVRFNTTAIHRYAYKTLKRDAAIAYFAGVREVLPFTSTFIAEEDKPQFDFALYDPSQWVATNTRQIASGPTSAQGKVYRISNPSFDTSLVNWITSPGDGGWSQDRSTGHYAFGSAKVYADERIKELMSTKLSVVPGDTINVSCWVKWSTMNVTAGEAGMQLGVVAYQTVDDVLTVVSMPVLAQIDFADWTAHANSDFVQMLGTWTVPDGMDTIRVRMALTEEAHSGNAWFDLVSVEDATFNTGTLYKNFSTMSDFSKATVEFRDSGLIRSDSMWADVNPDSQNIEDTRLAPYVETIPATVPGGMWGDTIKTWASDTAQWGSPFAIVSITVDGNRRYQGNRVLHFYRASMTGEAGIKIKQFTNWVPLGLFRIGCVLYKPYANDNLITLRLRRMSDGVFIHEESVTVPTGRWYEYQTAFIEIPDTDDQEYQVMLTLEGDDEDELYLSDLYCEIARIRYFMRLGGLGTVLHEVSDLRYIEGYAQVVAPTPVNEMSVQAAILSPEAYAYGCTITPAYLK